LFLRHVGRRQPVADANHVLFFNAGEGYQVSHPTTGGDACLSVSQPLRRDQPVFRNQALRIDERAQVLVAMLRHSHFSAAFRQAYGIPPGRVGPFIVNR
jgi:AraC family transcriptional regulator